MNAVKMGVDIRVDKYGWIMRKRWGWHSVAAINAEIRGGSASIITLHGEGRKFLGLDRQLLEVDMHSHCHCHFGICGYV